ncbi:MAG: DUF721 domain-containing protein [Pseudolabrys sp.]|nr:DUF721 domain-containing protein [Pseudolabrys sp.]
MSKPPRSYPRALAELTGATLGDVLRRRGFASSELIARWADIAGVEIAAHSEPIKINWPRLRAGAPGRDDPADAATLVLRVDGPAALDIQHQAPVIIERVNRFFGWSAIGRLALRQAPLRRRTRPPAEPPPDAAEAERIAAAIPIDDDALRRALGRLGAAVKRK